MFRRIFSQGKRILTSPQESILSAATVIMVMIITSRVLGLVRQRVLVHFFTGEELSLFFAAFRLPDTVFEILVFGMFSSAFIPVFTKTLKLKEKEAWDTAARVVNIGLLIFIPLAFIFGIWARQIYSLVAPGFTVFQIERIVNLARILFLAQGLFVISYVLTGVLESSRRFLVPAFAPILYNLGIIFGIVILNSRLGLFAPVIGVVVGALAHLLVQLPLARKLGFRFTAKLRPNQTVKKIGKLALPRVLDLSFLQVEKTVELFLASLISTASYTYFTFANSLQLLPVSLFGSSLAKAALPTLARQGDNLNKFRRTFLTTFYEIVFLVLPTATILMVLRIPLVRLVFGARNFTWEATVQTGMVVSAFAVGIVFQAVVALLARAFYALHDTRTPVIVSLSSVILIILVDIVLVKGFSLPLYSLAVSFSFGVGVQAMVLFYLLGKKVGGIPLFSALLPVCKSVIASLMSGAVMFFLLKFFDRSVWVKRLSFLSKIDATALPFERFVLDTRYTFNLLILTGVVAAVGLGIYLGISFVLKSKEFFALFDSIKKFKISPPPKEPEPLTPPAHEIQN